MYDLVVLGLVHRVYSSALLEHPSNTGRGRQGILGARDLLPEDGVGGTYFDFNSNIPTSTWCRH